MLQSHIKETGKQRINIFEAAATKPPRCCLLSLRGQPLHPTLRAQRPEPLNSSHFHLTMEGLRGRGEEETEIKTSPGKASRPSMKWPCFKTAPPVRIVPARAELWNSWGAGGAGTISLAGLHNGRPQLQHPPCAGERARTGSCIRSISSGCRPAYVHTVDMDGTVQCRLFYILNSVCLGDFKKQGYDR